MKLNTFLFINLFFFLLLSFNPSLNFVRKTIIDALNDAIKDDHVIIPVTKEPAKTKPPAIAEFSKSNLNSLSIAYLLFWSL